MKKTIFGCIVSLAVLFISIFFAVSVGGWVTAGVGLVVTSNILLFIIGGISIMLCASLLFWVIIISISVLGAFYSS